MVQPEQRARNPLSAAAAAVLLLIAVIGSFWVPIYARNAPKLGDFPFFYWFQLIWMPVVMVLCYLAYLLMRTKPAVAAGNSGGAPTTDGREAK